MTENEKNVKYKETEIVQSKMSRTVEVECAVGKERCNKAKHETGMWQWVEKLAIV